MRDRLAAAGFDAADIAAVIATLKRNGFLNDARVAEQVVHSASAPGPAGDGLLLARLDARGIDEQTAETAVGRAAEGHSEGDRALRFAADWARRRRLAAPLPPAEDLKHRRQLFGALARRGFTEEHAVHAVEITLGPPPAEDF